MKKVLFLCCISVLGCFSVDAGRHRRPRIAEITYKLPDGSLERYSLDEKGHLVRKLTPLETRPGQQPPGIHLGNAALAIPDSPPLLATDMSPLPSEQPLGIPFWENAALAIPGFPLQLPPDGGFWTDMPPFQERDNQFRGNE